MGTASDQAAPLSAAATDAGTDSGVTSVEYGLAALVAGLFALLDAVRRTQGAVFVKLLHALPLGAVAASLRQVRMKVASAPLQILRLMLGLLRML